MQKPKNISWYWLLFAREQHLEAHLHGAFTALRREPFEAKLPAVVLRVVEFNSIQ